MDVVFDIDGTLANAEHRLHFIKDSAYFVPSAKGLRDHRPDWASFLSDEMVAKDTPIPQLWRVLSGFANSFNRVLFITGRPDSQRFMTWEWLMSFDRFCEHRTNAAHWLHRFPERLYMRRTGDRRPSHEIKRELLQQARQDGYNPTLVFEDRKDDTAMWRSEGLLCCQVAEGDY